MWWLHSAPASWGFSKMSRHRATLLALFSVAVSVFPSIGNAKNVRSAPTAGPESRSAALIAQGVLALASRNFTAAYSALSEAYLIDHSPDTLYQLGIVAYADGQTVCSQDLMRRYLAMSTASDKNTQQRAEAERIVSQPQGQSSEILLSGSIDQSVYLDGKLVGVLPLPLPLLVSAGKHSLIIKDKQREHSATIEAAPHRAYQVTIGNGEGSGQAAVQSLPTVVWAIDSDRQNSPSGTHPLIEKSVAKAGVFAIPPILSGREECKADERCLIRIAEQSYADYLLRFHGVQAATAAGGTVTLSLLDSQIGEVAASKSFSCSPCTDATLAESTDSLLAELLTQATSRGRGFLHIQSQPPGAMVHLGGRKLGATPIRIPRFAGPIDVELTRSGYVPKQQHSEVQAGQTAEVSAELAQEVVAPLVLRLPPERRPRPKWRIALGISSLGIGLGLIGFGAAALSISGSCVEEPVPPIENCTHLYQTKTVGAALIATGSVLSGAGILFLAIPGPRNKDYLPIPSDSSGPWSFSN